MASYIILEPPASRDSPSKQAMVLRDGFSIFAFLWPLLWFLWHRMWLAALGLLIISGLIIALGTVDGFTVAPLIGVGINLFVGLEARAMRVAFLRRRGWHEWGLVDATSVDEAELIYHLRSSLSARPYGGEMTMPRQKPAKVGSTVSAPATSPQFGLIDYP